MKLRWISDHRATLGGREFGCGRDRLRELRLVWLIVRGRRLDETRAPVQLFDGQIQRGGQRLDHRFGRCPQSPLYLRKIGIGNPDRRGQLTHGQRRKLALFPDDRAEQTLWFILIHLVRLTP